MVCNNCKTEYDARAKTCPNCGAPNVSDTSVKKNKLPVWMYITAILSVVLIFSYVFCLSKGILFKDDKKPNKQEEIIIDCDGTYIDEYPSENHNRVEVDGETTTEEEPMTLPENGIPEKETDKKDDKNNKNEYSSTKPGVKPTVRPTEKTTEKQTEKPTEKMTEKTTEKPPETPTENSTEKPPEKQTENQII